MVGGREEGGERGRRRRDGLTGIDGVYSRLCVSIVRCMKEYLSSSSLVVDGEVLDGYHAEGRQVDGTVHARTRPTADLLDSEGRVRGQT